MLQVFVCLVTGPKQLMTKSDARGTCHVMLAVVIFLLVTVLMKASERHRKANAGAKKSTTWQSEFDYLTLEESEKQQV